MSDDAKIPTSYALVSIVVVFLLIWGVKIDNVFMCSFFDPLFSSMVQSEHLMFLTPIMKLITNLADTKLDIIYTVILAVIMWFKRKRVESVWTLCTVGGGAVIAFLIKEFVKRPRPGINQIVPETGYSMPSGHTFMTFLLLSIIYLLVIEPMMDSSFKSGLTTVLVIWQILVIFSRIFMGAHYLTDTIVAVALGEAWMWIAVKLYRGLYNTVKRIVGPRVQPNYRQPDRFRR